MKKITRSFESMADRYKFDLSLSTSEGWAQLDSGQDASYYGQWVNPFERKTFAFVEGDKILVEYDTDQEFIEGLKETQDWDLEHTGKTGIDPGFNEGLRQKFLDMGISLEYRFKKD